MIVLGTNGDDTLNLNPSWAQQVPPDMTIDGSPTYSFSNIQQFEFDGEDGNDTMNVDSGRSLLTLTGGVLFNGGMPGFNSLGLTQTGGTDTRRDCPDTYSVGPNPGQGSDVITGPSGTQSVFFQGLAPAYDNVPATTLTVNGTNADNAINYMEGDDATPAPNTAWGQVSVDNQEPINFSNKDNLVINDLAGKRHRQPQQPQRWPTETRPAASRASPSTATTRPAPTPAATRSSSTAPAEWMRSTSRPPAPMPAPLREPAPCRSRPPLSDN